MSAPVEWDAKVVIGQRARPRPTVAASNSSLNGVSCLPLSSFNLDDADSFSLLTSCMLPYAHCGADHLLLT